LKILPRVPRADVLDYVDISGGWSKKIGRFALVVGFLVFVATIIIDRSVQMHVDQLDQLIRNTQLRHGGHTASMSRQTSSRDVDELRNASIVAAELVLPWEALFQALESVDREGVKIQNVEPDAYRKNLQITAIAASNDAMLDYISALQEVSVLKKVTLTSQENDQQATGQPIRFAVNARWILAP
jgi:Tfp pilus assembly protein PilN